MCNDYSDGFESTLPVHSAATASGRDHALSGALTYLAEPAVHELTLSPCTAAAAVHSVHIAAGQTLGAVHRCVQSMGSLLKR